MAACSRRGDPQAALDHAISTLHHGDIAGAGKEAKKGYEQFHGLSTDWAWKFTILRGRVLYWGGRNDDALKLLAAEPSPPCCGDLAVQKLRLEGVIHSAQHRFQDAERELAAAKAICSAGDYPACGDLNSTLGRLEMEHDHFDSGERFFERALASARGRRDQFMEASSLLDLSWSAEEQTHFDEALDRANAALAVSRAEGFPDAAETALGNTGWAYYKLGDVEKAEMTLRQAEDEAEKLGDLADQARWQLDLGYIYSDNGDLPAARDSYRKSLDLARKLKGEQVINALQSLAFVSEQANILDDAKRYADEALSMARTDGNKRDETYPRLVQGRIAAKEHDPAAAETAFHEVAESPDSPVFLKWEAERSLARLYEDENQVDAASGEYRTALSTFESARSGLQHEDSRLPFLTNASGIYDDYIRFLVAHRKTDDALQVAEYERGRTLAEGLGVLKSDSAQKSAPDPTSRANNAREMGHPAAEKSGQNGKTFRPEAIDPRAIARRAGGTIFFYSLGEKQSYLWAITPQKTSFFALPPKSEIDPVVQRYRKELAEQMESLPQAEADGRKLYQALVAPAQALLAGNKDARVFIIPDGSLNTLNFETLRVDADNSPPHYWIEDATIGDASSLHVLAASRSPQRLKPQSVSLANGTAGSRALPIHALPHEGQPASDQLHGAGNRCGAALRRTAEGGCPYTEGSLLLLGDAISPSADYPELRKAPSEMERIEKHFAGDQQQVFARERATPAAYLTSNPEQFSYIHFVAHGTASRVSPLDSAIVFSPAGTQDDSFKLYARDIIAHPRLHADLVTISTCYGAGSRAYSGEGLVGLSWAFLRAGAHNVIGALWEVSDVSTPQLMDELYGGLKQGQPPDVALRAAKLSLLRSKSAFSKPFYWAPFQLYTGS